jgi:predicted nucleotidyltransferase
VSETGHEVPEELERAQRFAWTLEGLYDEALVSVALFGSAARGEYRPGLSDLNLLVLLRTVDAAALRRGNEVARAWVAEGNPPPMVLSLDEWRASADVFAIEVSDIRDAHLVLAGVDPFEGVTVDPAHLRLQCERELKGKKLQLRERYLLSACSPEELGALLLHSFPTFLVLFRTVLRLVGEDPAADPSTVVRRVAALAGFPPTALLEIHEARNRGAPLLPQADDPVVVQYLDAVSRVSDFVDRRVHDAAGGERTP